MKYLTKRNVSIVSAVLATVLGLQLILYLGESWFWQDQRANAAPEYDSQENHIVADLSNLTGATAEEIRKLRSAGLSWNEVIEALKGYEDRGASSTRTDREAALLNELPPELLAQLQEDGYSDEDIYEVKLIAERVLFQLTEIVQDAAHLSPLAHMESTNDQALQDKQNAYKALLESFQLEEAVPFMLIWETELGSYRQAMNAYLFILQAGLDVAACQQDVDGCLVQKDSLRLQRSGEAWITMEDIERELLELVQMSNATTDERMPLQPEAPAVNAAEWQSPLPEVIIPQARNVKPVNPTDAIMEEIGAVDPREGF